MRKQKIETSRGQEQTNQRKQHFLLFLLTIPTILKSSLENLLSSSFRRISSKLDLNYEINKHLPLGKVSLNDVKIENSIFIRNRENSFSFMHGNSVKTGFSIVLPYLAKERYECIGLG